MLNGFGNRCGAITSHLRSGGWAWCTDRRGCLRAVCRRDGHQEDSDDVGDSPVDLDNLRGPV